VPFGGGTPIEITAVQGYPSGATWGPDDRIVFSGGCCSALNVVDINVGRAELLTTLEGDERAHSRPKILPGGRALLYHSGGWIHALDLERGRSFPLVEGGSPEYTANGHLIFARDMALFAAPFDPENLEVTGSVVPVVEGVATAAGGRAAHYAISRSGTLAHLPATESYALALVAPDGTERRLTTGRPLFENPRFSHDGRRVVAAVSNRTGQPDLWLYHLDSGTEQRLTFDGGRAPIWTPDDTAVTFSHLDEDLERQGIYTKRVDGRGEAERVVGIERFHWLVGWTPDGRTLAFGQQERVREDGTSPSSIMAFTDDKQRYVIEPGDIWGGRLSPNGEWLAYYERVAGRFEVFVTAFPEAGPRYQITEEAGGRDPAWSPDGNEVYYRTGDRLMAAKVDRTAAFRVLSRRVVIEPFSPPGFDDYDTDSDGRTLVLVRPVGDGPSREITVAVDWLAELRESMP
jgi:hypothetical protein